MRKPQPPKHLRFAVLAADTVLFAVRDGELMVRLIRVHRPPYFVDKPGFPGGLLQPSETAEEAARRTFAARTGVSAKKFYLEQLVTLSRVDRDPRGRVVAVAYLAVVPWEDLSPGEREDTQESWWAPVKRLPALAYDHNELAHIALERLRARIGYTTIAAKLLPGEFTLTDLEQVYAAVLGRPLDRRNFRKKIAKLGLLRSLGRERRGGKWRPAKLYAFRSAKVESIDIL